MEFFTRGLFRQISFQSVNPQEGAKSLKDDCSAFGKLEASNYCIHQRVKGGKKMNRGITSAEKTLT